METSKKQKWIFITSLLTINAFLVYFFAYLKFPTEMRSNPYLFLGYLRGAFSSICAFFGPLFILINSESLTKFLQKLKDINKGLKISQAQLKLAFLLVIFELLLIYTHVGITFHNIYSYKEENLILRILPAAGTTLLAAQLFTVEIFMINTTGLITQNLKMVNSSLRMLQYPQGTKISLTRPNNRIEKIIKIRRLYENLYDVKEILNHYISTSLLMSITLSFADVIFAIFMNIIGFQRNITSLTLKQELFIGYEHLNMIKIFIIIAVANSMSKKIKETGLILARLIINATDYKERNEVTDQNLRQIKTENY